MNARAGRIVRGVAAAAAATSIAHALAAGEELRNWFDDPFFPLSSAIAGCPEPAGPRLTEAERATRAHHRAEKGTTCWLAGQCDRPSYYAYDPDIARAIAGLAKEPPFADATLWVTVQARVVYVEGCVRAPDDEARIEAAVRALPYVLQAIAIVRSDAAQPVPYRRYDAH